MIREVLDDIRRETSTADIARSFHCTMAQSMVAVARANNLNRVVLSGGCMQNRLLVEFATFHLEAAGFEVFRHRNIPPNDGGIAIGQAVIATASKEE
jgi:hydrogenase maturation protein HypF